MIVTGKVMWAHLAKPNELSGKYQVDLTQLDDATVNDLKAAGVPVHKGEGKKEGYGWYVTAKATKPVAVVAADKSVFDSAQLGNGSVVKCSIKPYAYDYKGKKGTGCGLQAVMVTTPVLFVGTGLAELEADAKDNVPF